MFLKKTASERVFDFFNTVFMFLISLTFLYPMLYVIFASFSDPRLLIKYDGMLLKPLGLSTIGYGVVLHNPNILSGYMNTIINVVVGTILNILMTSLGAYVLSRKYFFLKTYLAILIIFTMYFSGGLIPNFLLVKNIGLYDTRWAVIVPVMINTWNLIVMRTAFSAIPDSLEESAKMDGANDFTILFRIILPVAKATVAIMILFYAVAHWNAWFNSMIYLRRRNLYPVQLILREILIANSSGGNVLEGNSMSDDDSALVDVVIRYCTIVVATVPILFIYPFCQKYFVTGVMLGSVKG